MDVLTGEPLALDLVNTRARTSSGAEYDALARADDCNAWLSAQSGRLTVPEAPLAAADLPAIRQLRGHVEVALAAVRDADPPPIKAVAAINEAMRAAPPYACLEAAGAVLKRGRKRDGTPLTRLLAELAEAATALLTDPDVGKVRGCEAPHCRMLFLPAHPRRRWCSPDLCGNRVRVARYHQRHKTT
ncbi:CGNR zinc finger domain-containing protein [Nonomuraea purpurea]|uniref:CGNR zinc finger domain-containing protein n=1 Tax=Nonomuraea purpurea TaxID=1849276 RepID=A0ABV8GQX9_9ACTN